MIERLLPDGSLPILEKDIVGSRTLISSPAIEKDPAECLQWVHASHKFTVNVLDNMSRECGFLVGYELHQCQSGTGPLDSPRQGGRVRIKEEFKCNMTHRAVSVAGLCTSVLHVSRKTFACSESRGTPPS